MPQKTMSSGPRPKAQAGSGGRGRLKGLLLTLFVLVALSYVSYQSILMWMGSYLVKCDAPTRCDAIVAVGEPSGESETEAARLYAKEFAPRVVMTGNRAGWRHTVPELMASHARSLGVPSYAIITQPPTETPFEAARRLKVLAKTHEWRSIIVVAAPMESRRMRQTFSRFFPAPFYRVSVVPRREPRFGPDSWWLCQDGRDAVILEWARLAWYRARYGV